MIIKTIAHNTIRYIKLAEQDNVFTFEKRFKKRNSSSRNQWRNLYFYD